MSAPTAGHDFDALAPWYDLVLKVSLLPWGGERRVRRRVAAALSGRGIAAGGLVLEAGCGTGANLASLDESCREGCRLVGLDRSLPMLRQAERKGFARRALLVRGDAAALPFPAASFDAALSVLTLHELPGDVRERAVGELARVIRPGGCLLVADLARPEGDFGRLLFGALALFEGGEAMAWASAWPGTLLEAHGFDLERTGSLFFGLIRLETWEKRGQ